MGVAITGVPEVCEGGGTPLLVADVSEADPLGPGADDPDGAMPLDWLVAGVPGIGVLVVEGSPLGATTGDVWDGGGEEIGEAMEDDAG